MLVQVLILLPQLSCSYLYVQDYFDKLCIKNIFESEKFEQEPTFEKNINDIKANHLKSITSIDMDV